jgi:hypothetical protein
MEIHVLPLNRDFAAEQAGGTGSEPVADQPDATRSLFRRSRRAA